MSVDRMWPQPLSSLASSFSAIRPFSFGFLVMHVIPLIHHMANVGLFLALQDVFFPISFLYMHWGGGGGVVGVAV